MSRLALLIFFCSISGYHTLLNPYPRIRTIPFNGDADDPLFLTPYIEEGKIQEGQAASKVELPFTNVTSYTGYLTVNKTFNSNLFFWYFPAEVDPKNAPVVLWLQGGPGSSSLYGLFCENGPFSVDVRLIVQAREHYWSQFFNVIYIDNPVGTGYSFTENDAGYATDQVKVGEDLYSALLQFFQLFPDLQKNEFFVSGESYAGKYIPAIGYTIHNNNKINKQKINLKGLAIGNGLTDPENMMVYADYVYQLGLVDSNTREVIRNLQDKAVKLIRQRQYSEANTVFHNIVGSLSPHINIYNYLESGYFDVEEVYSDYVQMDFVRIAIHVGNRDYSDGSKAGKYLENDIMQSVKPWVEVLLENYRVMFYSGQLDIVVAYPLTMNFLPKLNWTGSEEYRTAPRKEWKVDDELAGFYKKAKTLTEVFVRDAGHMVPKDQSKWALDMITQFVYNNISGYHTLLNPYPRIRTILFNGDAGDPLFLTPYIEEGRIQEGQEAARVSLPKTNITSYSGYFTVNKTFNSNLFFWFFPSEADPKNAPVVLWLQGGPGGSSLFGLFCENGPFSVDTKLTLQERQYSWSQLFNVIYIDNPVGTGFSFTESDSEYATDEVKVGKDLYSALSQFFQLFPDLQKNDFFVSGESYAGKYIPAIGYTIHNNNKINRQKINLKGLAIGDGFTDPENMMVYADYVYQLGLVDSNTREELRNLQDEVVKLIRQHQYSEASTVSDEILGRLSPRINGYNYLQSGSFDPEGAYSDYLQTDVVRRGIHVGSRTYNDGSKVGRYLANDVMQSVKPWVEVLLENYRVMFYSGQLDIIVAYPLTMNFLPKLNWTGAEDYRTAPRKEWKVDDELAGFYKKAKTLTEVLVRDAGHMVPQDQPKWALDLIARFVYNNGYICHAFLNPYPKFRSIASTGDAGDPLFLTPYIEEGRIQEGQEAAKVKLPGTNVTSYSGYLTVNKTFNSNLFFWYFPSEADPKNAPVVLWLQGGPGASSLFGLFCENGPFSVDKSLALAERKYYWSQLFNVIYIDNPVGTGFSFTESDSEYATDEVKVGKDLYSALSQFFQLFPDLQKNDFFVSGESYAGKYIPAIGYTIHNNNKVNRQKINLKGLAIGDGYTDPENMMVYADYLYQLGLVDSNAREELRNLQKETVELIRQHNYSEARVVSNQVLYSLSPQINVYNYLQSGSFDPEGPYSDYLQTDGVRKGIHVGNRTYNGGSTVGRYLANDVMQSVKPWVEVLLENYRVMFYSGQLDIIVAYPLTMNFLPKLNWTGSEDYKTAPRKEWKVDDELAGFYKNAKTLTEVLVRDAGHMVPQDQPKWALDLIARFVHNNTVSYVSCSPLNMDPKIQSISTNSNVEDPLILTQSIEEVKINEELPGTNMTCYSAWKIILILIDLALISFS
ncbi:unnamed protein product [Nezara viridula]|uniref:Carboxypeptidase n=1 Tax=Nezara viridula TaxID=85310 RepID=A0A9P0H248_NEZVI|nr:unnamed protein product [Nezara viridula]